MAAIDSINICLKLKKVLLTKECRLFKIHSNKSLLTENEVNNILYSEELFRKNSFQIIDNNKKEYDENNHDSDFDSHVSKLEKASCKGATIIVKNMGSFNEKIKETAQDIGVGTQAYLHVIYHNDSNDKWMSNIKDTWIKMINGQQMFCLKYNDTTVLNKYSKDDYLFIPAGLAYKSISIESSAFLSFEV